MSSAGAQGRLLLALHAVCTLPLSPVYGNVLSNSFVMRSDSILCLHPLHALPLSPAYGNVPSNLFVARGDGIFCLYPIHSAA